MPREMSDALPGNEAKEPKPVGIWVRVSHEDQVTGESPEHHEYRGRMFAEARGWTVVKVYRLDAVSGKSVMGLPETEEMLGDVRSGMISGLIFSKLARLARNTRELIDFEAYFREHGADLISLGEPLDTTTPYGRHAYRDRASLAEYEREELADRVAASVPIRARMGKPLGGAGSYGYRWVPTDPKYPTAKSKRLIPDPEEAPVRRLMYELFLEHRRVKTVARLLNERGHRTRNGSRFTHTTVERLLRDPTAKGIRRANYSKSLGARKKWVMKPEEEWIMTEVEPIVPAELWDEVNAILDQNKRPAKRTGGRPTVHLFTGFAFCDCGERLYVPSNSPKYVCRRCRNKIPLVDLERVFADELRKFFFSPEKIASHLEEGDAVLRERSELLSTLVREQEKAASEMEKVYRLYVEDAISPAGFKERYRPLEERRRQLGEEILRLRSEVDFLKLQHLTTDRVVTHAQDLYTRWEDLPFEERRRIAESIVGRITVGKEDVAINLSYFPSLSEMMAERSHTDMDSSRRAARTGLGRRGGRGCAPG